MQVDIAKGGNRSQGIGRSRDGLTSTIVAVVDALGFLARFMVLPGQVHDLAGMPDLVEGLSFRTLIGVKVFDADWLLNEVTGGGAEAVIPSNRSRTEPLDHDREVFKWRHEIENFFARIKEFRAVATRYDKTAESFAAAIHLVARVVAAT